MSRKRKLKKVSGPTVTLGTVSLDDVEDAPYNPRTISPEALGGLSKSIQRWGLVQPIIVNTRTNRIVGGHQRAKTLRLDGITETEAVLVDLSETEEKALNLSLNSPAISGEFTASAKDLIDELLEATPELGGDLLLQNLRADLDRQFPVTGDLEDGKAPDPPEEPETQPGDLYLLGNHRLLCGDATSADDVALAMGEHKPFMMVTDPPYGVDYDPAWWKAAGLGATGRTGAVKNDDTISWTEAWELFRGPVAYIWHASYFTGQTWQDLIDAKFQVRASIIWNKSRFAISRGHYHWQHEPCWYAVRKSKSARWTGDRKQSTIWDIPMIGGGDEDETNHSTQKPVECMGRPMRNHGKPGDVVYDPFVGSGTTIIAAEQLKRICVALEIDPGYCDVVVERWESLTGGKAERIRHG